MMSEMDKRVIQVLQGDIPLARCPYALLAAKAGMEEDAFLERVRALKDSGCLRRIGAVLQHRRVGFTANALCVWEVPAARLDEVGAAVSKEAAVSHCYERQAAPGWPYNFYAMLHATSREECDATARRLAAENGLGEAKMFYSVKEWKKASMKYFTEEPGLRPDA